MKAFTVAIIISLAALGSIGSGNANFHSYLKTCSGINLPWLTTPIDDSDPVSLYGNCKLFGSEDYQSSSVPLKDCFSWDPWTCTLGYPPGASGFIDHCSIYDFDNSRGTLFCRCDCFKGSGDLVLHKHSKHSVNITLALDDYIGNQNGTLTC